MPIYEYLCNACQHTLDALQKVDEEPLKFCPECGAESLRKLISAPSFRLKGGGWYETDFKTGNRKNIAGEKSPDSAKKDAGKDGAKEAKKEPAKAAPASKPSASASSSGD